MDGSVDVSAVRSGLLDEAFVYRASTSFRRGEAALLYRVLRAARQGDKQQVAECAADPNFLALLKKALRVHKTCEERKAPRRAHGGRSAWNEQTNRLVEEAILRLVADGTWVGKTSRKQVRDETNSRWAQVQDRYRFLLRSGRIKRKPGGKRMIVVNGEPDGPRSQ